MTRVSQSITLAAITALTALLYSPLPASALTPSPTPTGTIRDSVRQKVQEELSRIQKPVAKKGFVGSITAKSDATLTLTTLSSHNRVLLLTPDTTIKLPGGKDGTIADIKTNDFVLAMGDVDTQNTMTVKRLLVINPPAPDRRVVLTGRVDAVAANSLTLLTAKAEKLEIKAIAATKYHDTTKFSDLKPGHHLVVIATPAAPGSKTSFTALHIRLLE